MSRPAFTSGLWPVSFGLSIHSRRGVGGGAVPAKTEPRLDSAPRRSVFRRARSSEANAIARNGLAAHAPSSPRFSAFACVRALIIERSGLAAQAPLSPRILERDDRAH